LKDQSQDHSYLDIPALTSDNEIADSKAFIALADTKLRNALVKSYSMGHICMLSSIVYAILFLTFATFDWIMQLYHYWCEPLNFQEVTSRLYGAQYPKPLDQILMYQMKSAVVKELLTRKPVLHREEVRTINK
jgi:hypothetical protein